MWIIVIFFFWEDMWGQSFVECVEYIGNVKFVNFFDCCFEVGLKVLQQLFLVQVIGRNFVELIFQVCGKVVFDIVVEEIFQEGNDYMVFVFGVEVVFVYVDIVVIVQYLQC